MSCELGMYLCAPLCRHLLSFDPVVPRPAVVPLSPVSACRSCLDLDYRSVHPVTRLCDSDSSSP